MDLDSAVLYSHDINKVFPFYRDTLGFKVEYEQPDNFVDPDNLSPLERGHLKDAFRVVQTMQEALIQRFSAATLV